MYETHTTDSNRADRTKATRTGKAALAASGSAAIGLPQPPPKRAVLNSLRSQRTTGRLWPGNRANSRKNL
jgi:hypothetical protein